MTNERLKNLYIRGIEQDFTIPGGKSFFYQICSRKPPFSNYKTGDEEQKLQEWKSFLEAEKNLWTKIAYCEKKLIDADWYSVYIRELG